MRTRLLLVLAVLGAIVVTAFAVPLALSTAEARTGELVANRQAHLQRFAGLAEDYVRAMQLREHLTRRVNAAMHRCDALLLPALPIPAPLLGTASVDVDGASEPVRAVMLRLTQLFNITGHPAIALPAGTDPDGWPLGLQLVGAAGRTARLLAIAALVEAR